MGGISQIDSPFHIIIKTDFAPGMSKLPVR